VSDLMDRTEALVRKGEGPRGR